MIHNPPISTLFPYTTLFRSLWPGALIVVWAQAGVGRQSHPKPPQGHIVGIYSTYTPEYRATSKPPQGHHKAIYLGVQSHPKATPKPPSCDLQARYMRPASQEIGRFLRILMVFSWCSLRIFLVFSGGTLRGATAFPPSPEVTLTALAWSYFKGNPV